MAGLVEKNYGDALFELISEENPGKLVEVRDEMSAVNTVLSDSPELVKLMKTPTVEVEEKLALMSELFKSRVSDYTYRFLMVLTESGRISEFGGIYRYFSALCNEKLGIAEVTVITTEPLDDAMKAKIKLKMTQITGKTIVLKERTDPSIIGGIVLKYGDRSFDGSVKARLDAMKKEIGSVIS